VRLRLDQPFPREIDLVVIGGGPGGASAGLAAARLGLRVLLLEQTRFPRHKLGETLPPKILPILSFLGVLPAVEAAAFVRMNGNTNLLGATQVEQFFTPGGQAFGFQVERDRFDEILLNASEREGVCVAEESSVSRTLLSRDDPARVVGVEVRRPGREPEPFDAPFVIDASGPSCLLARALGLRRSEALRSLALWGYWEETSEPREYPPGNTILEATPDGWIWSLPLSDGRRNVSCGIAAETARPSDLGARYAEVVAGSRLLSPILRGARLLAPARGYDATWYWSERYAGPGYFLVGEAASFVDPLTSQGVIKAMNSGILAAAAANTAIRRPADLDLALAFYDQSEKQTLADYRESAVRLYRNAAHGTFPFWRARHRAGDPPSTTRRLTDEERTERLSRFLELLRGTKPSRIHLRGVERLRVEPAPCLVGGFVERRPAIRAGEGRPHHSTADVSALLPLLDGRDLDSVYEGYAVGTGVPRTPDSARSLAHALGRLVEDGLVDVFVS